MQVKERFSRYLAMFLAVMMIMGSSSRDVLAAGVIGGYSQKQNQTREYTGDLDDVVISPEGQIPFTIHFLDENGLIRRQPYSVSIVQDSSGSYLTEYVISDVPEGYGVWLEDDETVIEGGTGVVELEDQVITAVLSPTVKSASVTVVYKANTVDYTVKSVFEGLDGSQEQSTTEIRQGRVDELTDVEADLSIAGFSPDPVNQQVIKADGSTVVTIHYVRNEYTVKYDTQGGSYIRSKSVEYEEEAVIYLRVSGQGVDPKPVRRGYEFGGWYTEEACINPAQEKLVFDETVVSALTDHIYTVYAKWIPQTADYREVLLAQVWDHSTGKAYYAYYSSQRKAAKVGELVTAGSHGNVPYCTYARSTTAQVKADGSTVVYAYYDLKPYRFVFELKNSDARLTIGGATYKDREYVISAVYGQDISSRWPTGAHVQLNGSDFYKWHPDNGSADWVTKRFEVSKEMLPKSGNTVICTAIYRNGLTKKAVEYYLQSVDGKTYEKSETYSQVFYTVDPLDPKDLYGFTNRSRTPAGYPESDNSTYRFYYDRDQKTITYLYGSKELAVKSVYFGADIHKPEYMNAPSREACGITDSEYTFAGWYDHEMLTGNPYLFTVMPGNNLALYAKWQAPEKVVTLIYKDGVTPDQTIKVIKGETAEIPVPEREGYLFDGWYEDSQYIQEEFDVNAPIMRNISLYAKWIPGRSTTYVVRHIADEKVFQEELFWGRTGNTVTAKAVKYKDYVADSISKSMVLDHEPSKNVMEFHYYPPSELKYVVQYIYGDDIIKAAKGMHTTAAFREYPDQTIADELNGAGYVIRERFVNVALQPGENVVVFHLDLKRYSITYDLNGAADWINPNPISYTIESLPITLVNPVREGFDFEGWTTENTVLGTHEPMKVVLEKGTKGNLKFTATWKPLIRVVPYSGVYDGEAHSVTVTGAPAGSSISYSTDQVHWTTNMADVSFTDVIESKMVYVKVTGDCIIPAQGCGTVTITPKAVTLVSADLSKEYDGIALKNGDTPLAVEDGWVTGEGADYIFTGKQLTKGESKNSFDYVLKAGTKAGNYIITKKEGMLSVTDRTEKYVITLVANSSIGNIYNGTWQSVEGVETDVFTINGVVFTVSGYTTSDPEEIDAGTYPNIISGTCVVRDSEGNNVTDQFTVQTVNGSLEIGKRPITITADDKTADYTGDFIGADQDGYTVSPPEEDSGLLAWQRVSVGSISGEQMFVGVYPDELVLEDVRILELLAMMSSRAMSVEEAEGDVTDNYDITLVPGTLTIVGDSVIPEKTTPEVESKYKLGDKIPFSITVKNITNVELKNVTVTDSNAFLTIGAGYVLSNEHEALIASIEQGETITLSAWHVVTEEDIIAGMVENVAVITVDDKVYEATADTDELEGANAALCVDKVITNPEAMVDGKYLIGSTIQYEIIIKNTGNLTLTGVQVQDDLTASKDRPAGSLTFAAGDGYTVNENQITVAEMIPNAQITIAASYLVSKDDASKTLTNVAAGSAVNPDPNISEPLIDSSEPVEAVIEDGPGDNHLYNGKITVNKSVTRNGKAKKVNDTIYVALFGSDGKIVQGTEVQSIILSNASKGSTTFEKLLADDTTYKVVEVNESGKPVKPGKNGFAYNKIIYTGQTAILTKEKTAATVSIENRIEEKEETCETEISGEAVKTGDNTNILLYVIMITAAIAIIAYALRYRKR